MLKKITRVFLNRSVMVIALIVATLLLNQNSVTTLPSLNAQNQATTILSTQQSDAVVASISTPAEQAKGAPTQASATQAKQSNSTSNSSQVGSLSSFSAVLSSEDITLVHTDNYSNTVDISSASALSSVEAISYKSSVLEVSHTNWLDTPFRKHFVIKLLNKPVTGDGSMAVVFEAKDTQGRSINLQLVVRWSAFKYMVSVDKPNINAGIGVIAKGITTPISISNVPSGDKPVVTFTITTDLPFAPGQPLTHTYVYSPLNIYPVYSIYTPTTGKEYTYSVRVTIEGMSSYDHTFVIKFVY